MAGFPGAVPSCAGNRRPGSIWRHRPFVALRGMAGARRFVGRQGSNGFKQAEGTEGTTIVLFVPVFFVCIVDTLFAYGCVYTVYVYVLCMYIIYIYIYIDTYIHYKQDALTIQYTHDHAHTMHREYMHVHGAICMLHTFGLETSKVPMVTLLELEPSLRARCVKAGWRRSESRTPGPDSDRGDHPAVKGQYKAVIFCENV